MQFSVAQLATLTQGKIHGPAERVVRAASTLKEAGPDDITFIEHERVLRLLKECKASVIVVPSSLVSRLQASPAPGQPLTLLEVDDPLGAFIRIVQHLRGQALPPPTGIHPRAHVDSTSKLGADCAILPLAVIGENSVLGSRCCIHPHVVIGRNCKLGDDVTLYPGVVLYDNTVIGNRVIVHSNAVLGADGYGYRFQGGEHIKVPQLGHTEIGDDVEIGACATIDRGTFGPTSVGQGTKIDNLVMIGHNCRIGRHSMLISQVGLAGSCTVGDYVVIAGQSGVADHVTINDRAVIGARSGVFSEVPAGARMLYYPCLPDREAKRVMVSLPNLPELVRDVRQIKQRLGMDKGAGGSQEKAAG